MREFLTIILLLTFCFPMMVFSNDETKNTMFLDSTSRSPKANISQIAWLAGHWQGEAFGGKTEEMWSAPKGGAMMGSFRLVADGNVKFYELQVIREVDETLELNLKHFNADMTGWEEKEKVVTFKLVKIEEGKVFFDGFTIERVSDDEINMYVVIGHKDGSTEETKFNYKRVVKS